MKKLIIAIFMGIGVILSALGTILLFVYKIAYAIAILLIGAMLITIMSVILYKTDKKEGNII